MIILFFFLYVILALLLRLWASFMGWLSWLTFPALLMPHGFYSLRLHFGRNHADGTHHFTDDEQHSNRCIIPPQRGFIWFPVR
jgi:hypothetical protein